MANIGRWVYPPVGFIINVVLGTIYSWSVFRLPLERLFSWTAFESSLPFTVFLAAFAVTMPIAGCIMARFGPRKTALIGAVLVGAGWTLASVVDRTPFPLVFMLIFYGLVAGVGVGLVYGVPIAVSSKWIPDKKGLAVGITILGFGLSPLITAVTAAYMIQTVGVLITFLYLGATFALLLVLLSLPLRFPPTDWQPPASVTAKKQVALAELTTRQMVGTRTFAGLWLTYVLGTTGGFIAISLAAKYGCDICGLTPAVAASATAVFAVFNGVGRPVFGYLCDRMGPRKVAIASYAIILAATRATELPLYVATFSVLWFSFGGWLAIAPAATSTFFGLKNSGQNYGVVFTAYGMGAIIGPIAASYIFSTVGSYVPVFLTTSLLAGLGMVVAAVSYKPVQPLAVKIERATAGI